MKYCIWNNKGGVGKTFLTYCLAVEYAEKNPTKRVAVIDMCPQANVSEMLLGGNGKGEENLTKCYENNRTIASYIKKRYESARFTKLGSELSFFVKVADYNEYMPKNLFLLPGDTDLDVCSSIIDYLALAPQKGAWLKSRMFLSDLMMTFEEDNKQETVFFIDCNPSFANYTQLAIVASDRLIVPCTADSSSIRGIYNIFRLIYGIREGDNLPLSQEDNIFDTFNEKMKETGTLMPKIHSFLLNKSRSRDKKATVAYNAHETKIKETVKSVSSRNPSVFTDTFDKTVLTIKDGNNLVLVVNHEGLPVSQLEHKKYEVYGEQTQVNLSQIEPFLENIHSAVSIL